MVLKNYAKISQPPSKSWFCFSRWRWWADYILAERIRPWLKCAIASVVCPITCISGYWIVPSFAPTTVWVSPRGVIDPNLWFCHRSVAKSCQTHCNPQTAAHQASLSFTIPWNLLEFMWLSRWCHPTISSSAAPFSSRPQSFPVSGSFPIVCPQTHDIFFT